MIKTFEKRKWIINLNRSVRMIVIAVVRLLRSRKKEEDGTNAHTIITINLIFCGFPLFSFSNENERRRRAGLRKVHTYRWKDIERHALKAD